jgi:hypothetical protein
MPAEDAYSGNPTDTIGFKGVSEHQLVLFTLLKEAAEILWCGTLYFARRLQRWGPSGP